MGTFAFYLLGSFIIILLGYMSNVTADGEAIDLADLLPWALFSWLTIVGVVILAMVAIPMYLMVISIESEWFKKLNTKFKGQ